MEHAFVNASAASDWRNILAERGINTQDFDSLLRKPTLSGNNFDQQLIDLKEFVATVEKTGSVKSGGGISWSVGLASNYAKRGKVGQAILGSKTLGTAFNRLVKFYPLIQDRTDVSLEVGEDFTTLGYRILDPDIWPRTEDALYTLGVFSSFIKTAAPTTWETVDILIEADKNVVKKDLTNEVCANVVYEAETNGIRFPTKILNNPIGLLPPVENDILNYLNRLLVEKRRYLPVSEKTRQAIFQGLSRGHVTQDHVAKTLGLSRRTLRRKLAAEEVSYQAILDECRMRAASLEFKISPNQSLSEMALKLGYSEHSTFSRAFMRWAGIAPQQFRKLH
ncbi:AraC-like transcriptional regulator QhpR [Kordiimonas laminariae]|uniref:AraC-like transcriptional regulator QhpR n=1 Tax=Kordiimonas laminariae TaxID=2917717 RepID=UPI001FF4C649|nr:AraC family transcriptional regulator [Kordiimonas laminariae]MCK0067823.1 helix-turn-helix domain-containing protein [Kordiimonas laminariae]